MYTKNELLAKYDYYRQINKLNDFLSFIIDWDSQTIAPVNCFNDRAEQVGLLSKLYYDFVNSKDNIEVINSLYNIRHELDDVLNHEIMETKKKIDEFIKIPREDYIELSTLLAQSQSIWEKAKQENNYNLFKPTLEKIVILTKKNLSYLETKKLKGYDILLDRFEPGMTSKQYDLFFDLLKKELVPFIKKIAEKKLNFERSFLSKKFSVEKQKEFCTYLQNVLCFDQDSGIMFESEHPFTTGFGTNDVRFTVHYYEDLPISSIFSTIHELGHATYEMQVDKSLNNTLSGGGASCALHESQSRFYENIIARDKSFWKTHYKKLKSIFVKELKNVSLDDFYKYINNVEFSLIRTEADELTYPIHIMIRYELEKALFNGDISFNDLANEWNRLTKEYLGLDINNDSEGILQDVHWSCGLFGYFPTYALGSAYASQFYNSMKKDLNMKKALSQENTKEINDWLRNNVHKYGCTLYPTEILKKATGQQFKPKYYVEYLIKKYSKIYEIKVDK